MVSFFLYMLIMPFVHCLPDCLGLKSDTFQFKPLNAELLRIFRGINADLQLFERQQSEQVEHHAVFVVRAPDTAVFVVFILSPVASTLVICIMRPNQIFFRYFDHPFFMAPVQPVVIDKLNKEIVDEFIDTVWIGKVNPETNTRDIDIELNIIKLA